MSCICPHTVPRRHLPHLDGLVSTARYHKVARGHERDTGHVVVVAEHRTDTLEALLEVPEFDAHV